MYQKLFGQTEAEQLQYLGKRVWLTVASLVLMLLGMVLQQVGPYAAGQACGGAGTGLLLVALFLWGFHAVKVLLGFGSVGAIFSGNVVLGAAVFLFAVLLAYVISIVIALLGIGHYVNLKIRAKKAVR